MKRKHLRRLNPSVRKRKRLISVYGTLYKRQTKGATVRQLSGWHKLSTSTIRRYLKIIRLQDQAFFVREKYRGHYRLVFFYGRIETPKERERREPRGPSPIDERARLEAEHDRFVSEERSPRIENIENYYRGAPFREAANAIRAIQNSKSLSPLEKQHVIEHLRIGVR